MASRYIYKIIGDIYLLIVLVCVTLLTAGCPMKLKYLKFRDDNNSTKKFTLDLLPRKILVEIQGIYWRQGPGLGFHLKILAKYAESSEAARFKPANIMVSFSDKSLIWYNPKLDSTYMKKSDNMRKFSLYYWRGSLTHADIIFLRDTEFPLRISLDSFIFINDTAVKIDTIYATSPELKYYNDW
jgi:hypothetical protein